MPHPFPALRSSALVGGRLDPHIAGLVQPVLVPPDASAQRARQELAAEADAEVGPAAVDPAPDPVDLGADVGLAGGVVHALGAAEADHRGVVAVGRRQAVAAARRAPFQAVAHLLKLRRGAVVAPAPRMNDTPNPRLRHPKRTYAGG